MKHKMACPGSSSPAKYKELIKFQSTYTYVNVVVTAGAVHQQWSDRETATYHRIEQVIYVASRTPRCTQHDHVCLNNQTTSSLMLTEMSTSEATRIQYDSAD